MRDSAGAPIAGAKVRFAGAATAESNTLADGSFNLFSLPTGQYKLVLVADGKTVMYAQSINLVTAGAAIAGHRIRTAAPTSFRI